jgi:epsilon-lactone hydrolase
MPAHLPAPDHEPMDDDPVLYQIRVNGHLGPILLSAFPALVSQQQGTETVLTGLLADAAALYGVLSEIEALGLELLEVRQVRPRPHENPGCAE